MFDYDIQRAEHFTDRTESVEAYKEWAGRVGIDTEDFPFKVNSGKFFKGKPINHNIRSWGSYPNDNGVWIVFVAYYSAPMKHTTQYAWRCDENGMVTGDPKKFEWIAG